MISESRTIIEMLISVSTSVNCKEDYDNSEYISMKMLISASISTEETSGSLDSQASLEG